MPKSKPNKESNTADLIKLSKLFMHDAARLTPETFKEYYLSNWQLISKNETFPLLELTREFILATAWTDFMELIMLISKVINEAANPQKTYYHNSIYPLSDELVVSFTKDSLTFLSYSNGKNNEVAALNLVNLRFIISKPKNQIHVGNTQLLNTISQTETFDALDLINIGADVNKYSAYYGNNPILLAVAKGWNHISDELPEDKLPGIENQKQIIEALLSREDLDINAINVTHGMTALHIACLRGDEPTLIELLLQKGAKLDGKDCYDMTPANYLDIDYIDLKKILPSLLNGYNFGNKSYAPNKSTMATIPTEQERARNVLLIKKIFHRITHDSVDDQPAKRPKFS
jgi:hypothetical protein